MSEISRRDFLLEFYRSAREEILLRAKWRDSWLKYQLIISTIIFGLSSGAKILNIEFSGNHSELLLLSLPISVITCAAYIHEEFIRGLLDKYLKDLSQAEYNLSNNHNDTIIHHWGSVKEKPYELEQLILKPHFNFFKYILRNIRLVIIIFSFFIIPFTLFILSLSMPHAPFWDNFINQNLTLIYIIELFSSLVIVLLIFSAFSYRFKKEKTYYSILEFRPKPNKD